MKYSRLAASGVVGQFHPSCCTSGFLFVHRIIERGGAERYHTTATTGSVLHFARVVHPSTAYDTLEDALTAMFRQAEKQVSDAVQLLIKREEMRDKVQRRIQRLLPTEVFQRLSKEKS